MAIRYLPVFIFLVAFLIPANAEEKVEKGILDLRNHSFSSKPIVRINGQWRFFWNQLLLPKECKPPDSFIEVPGYWNERNNRRLPRDGFATYSADILLPENCPELQLTIRDQYTSCRVFVDDSICHEQGLVGKSEFLSRIGTGGATVILHHGSRHRITMQISNYAYPRSGFASALVMGTSAELARYWQKLRGIDLFVMGALFSIGLINLFLFFFRKHEIEFLFLTIVCVTWAGRFFLYGMAAGRFVQEIFPSIPYITLLKLDLIPFFTLLPLVMLFFNRFFPGILNKWFVIITCAFYSFCTCYVALMPPTLWGNLTSMVDFLNLCMVVPGYYLLARALKEHRSGSLIMTIGFTLFVLAGINDTLNDLRLIATGDYVNFGVLALGISFTFNLTRRFARTLATVKHLSTELTNKDRDLQAQNRIVRENCELRNLVRRQTERVRQLRLAQLTLNHILFSISEPLFACDGDGSIVYLNAAFALFLSTTVDTLLDKPVSTLCAGNGDEGRLTGIFVGDHDLDDHILSDFNLRTADNGNRACTLHVSTIVVDDTTFFLFLVGNSGALAAMPFVRMINRNRDRITELETMLATASPGAFAHNDEASRLLGEIDRSLLQVHNLVSPGEAPEEKLANLGVDLLAAAIASWEKHNPKKGKVELARESGLWQVYINKDGWERTQTMDKYLTTDAFPRKPRWNRVFATVDFVLSSLPDNAANERELLEKQLADLRALV